MRITVDARLLRKNVGIGRYLREVTGRWLLRADVSAIRLLGLPGELSEWLADRDPRGIAHVDPWTDPVYSARAQIRWPLSLAGGTAQPDVTFFPHYDVPLFGHPSPSVVTVHDLSHVRVPRSFPPHKRLLAPVLIDGALRRASRVITVSERTRRDVLARHPPLRGHVHVVPNGVSDFFRPLTVEERNGEVVWERHKPFLLVVGTPRPHKNLELAVEVLARLRRFGRDLRLVIVGPTDRRASDVIRAARGLGVAEVVEFEGPVDDFSLRNAYSAGSLLLFPSLYEGFGLPPLEAMACGTPVLASPVGALPEVMADIAPLLDPRDIAAWTDEALLILDDTQERQRRIDRGLQRVKEYSWDRTADETLHVLRLAREEDG